MHSITPGSHAFRIIQLLLLVGEFPFQRLDMLGDRRTLKALAVKMSTPQKVCINRKLTSYEGRIITISGSGSLKTIRLCKWFFPVLEESFHEAFRYYLHAFPNHHYSGDPEKIERNHRVAEALAFMMLSGMESRPYETPSLQRMEIARKRFVEPAYYSSRYTKSLVEAQLQKTQYTRYVGILFYRTGCYVVYNSRNAVMRWNGEGEQKTTLDIGQLVSMNSEYTYLNSAVILVNDYQTALKTIYQCESGAKYVRLFHQNYQKMHFIPTSPEGRKMLQLLTVPNWQERMLGLLFHKDQIMTNTGTFQYDGLVGDTRVLCFMDCDVLKLISFHKVVRDADFPWSVICYDAQVSFLREYLGENADLRSINLNEFHKEMGAQREPLL